MGLMICENAKLCRRPRCIEKGKHEHMVTMCSLPCTAEDGILGSKCIPYIEPAKEPIAPLTGHPKYCRLSKQPGGLCARKSGIHCHIGRTTGAYFVYEDYTHCMRPESQQPVEIPKDPLEELIRDYERQLKYDILGVKFIDKKMREWLREFAAKVRAL